jgi:3-oxoacyl-[acyl-carrier protein] reductase
VIRLNKRHIIVTGTSRGIGHEITKKWFDSSKNNETRISFTISRNENNDITNYENMKKFIYECFEYYNNKEKPIALVNNAGVIELGNILELSTESWKKQFDVNINGMFNCSKTYVEACIKNKVKGKIINICSTAGLGARPGYSAYAASKAAAINFSLSLSKELKQYGIKVYCVCPGAVDTNMRHCINPDDDFENMMKPMDVANFIIDLVEDGEYLDGQILTIKK